MSNQTPPYHFVQASLPAEAADCVKAENSLQVPQTAQSTIIDLASDDPISRDNLVMSREGDSDVRSSSSHSEIKTESEAGPEDELKQMSADKVLPQEVGSSTKAADTDETISISSEESEANMSIQHDELYGEHGPEGTVGVGLDPAHGNGSPPTSVPSSKETPSSADSSATMPAEVKDRLETWYAKHGRYLPPCASTAMPDKLYGRNAAGETAIFVHKSGERLQARMYPVDNVQLRKGEWPKQRIIVATGPTHGPYIIRFTTQQNSAARGTGYKIWLGVSGRDKDGFESQASVYKQYPSTGKVDAKGKSEVKKGTNPNGIIPKPGFCGNQFYHADGTPKLGGKKRQPVPGRTSTAANGIEPSSTGYRQSSYEFRPAKRQKQAEESPTDYRKLLAAFSTHGGPSSSRIRSEQASSDQKAVAATSSHSEELVEHAQNNAVFLFYSKDSPQPRARLFSACNSVQKLFAQAIAGDVFPDDTKAAKVLSVRIGGRQKAIGIVETDVEDFENLAQAILQASHWAPSKNGYEGSCTVEVRSKV